MGQLLFIKFIKQKTRFFFEEGFPQESLSKRTQIFTKKFHDISLLLKVQFKILEAPYFLHNWVEGNLGGEAELMTVPEY